MAHDHEGAGHSHDHTAGANAKMLGWALALTSPYLIAEVLGGVVFNSLALLSAAGAVSSTPSCQHRSSKLLIILVRVLFLALPGDNSE